ncbi:MAG: HAD family hydrolase [Pirellulaceae bacterium]|nr:HAD family hydrolase [Pirellulaceae bacterium]
MIRGLIFDLDNTLVDSRLDFDAMRREMGIPADTPILESLERLSLEDAARCREILHRHELAGAARAILLPGVEGLWTEVERRGLRSAIVTRNSLPVAQATLEKVGLTVELLLTRDCGPTKPDPWPIRTTCEQWSLEPAEVVVIGDYRFDIECGRAAGARTVLLTHCGTPHLYPNDEEADLVLSSLAEFPRLLAWIDGLGS